MEAEDKAVKVWTVDVEDEGDTTSVVGVFSTFEAAKAYAHDKDLATRWAAKNLVVIEWILDEPANEESAKWYYTVEVEKAPATNQGDESPKSSDDVTP